VADATRQAANEEEDADVDMEEPEYEPTPEPDSPEDKAKKRKRQQAIEKIKKSKEFARRKARRVGEPDDDDDALANEMADERERPVPGQLENCEVCGKRFTVTPYSKAGPNGGLLCAECSKKHVDGDNKKALPKKRTPGIRRRQNQADLLDGLVSQGAQSLLETCIKVCSRKILPFYYGNWMLIFPIESSGKYLRRGRVWRPSSTSDASPQSDFGSKTSDHLHDFGSFPTPAE
jgi:DNA repair protein RAD7